MISELLLQSGEDIPFPQAGINIHQPRLREIALIGENDFHIGSHFLTFNKNDLIDKDKTDLENQNDFNIFMSVMNSHNKARHKTDALMVLTLLFPEYNIKINHNEILLQSKNFSSSINEQSYFDFKNIINQIFCLNMSEGDNFNPEDGLAKKIAEKIKKGKQKRAEKKGKKEDLENINVFSYYVSVLSVGLQKDKNQLMNYTVYQLIDEYKRFINKVNFDSYIQAKMAGAQDLEEVNNWMENTSLKN